MVSSYQREYKVTLSVGLYTRGVRVDHWSYPYPYPTRDENFYPYPTRPASIAVPAAYRYDYRIISVKPITRGETARVTYPNVI